MKFAKGLLALIAAMMPCAASAAAIEYHTFKDNDGYITIIGDIEEGDAEKVQRIAATSTFSTVFLESYGGNLSEAIKIGRIINVSNARTVVVDDAICTSSCALIWLAGSPRIAQVNSKIGFHAGYVIENNQPVSSGVANAMVGRYLTQLGLSERAVMYATAANPDDMLWIDTSSPGKEGFSYEIFKEDPEPEAAPTPKTATAKAPQKAAQAAANDELNGKVYGAWVVRIMDDMYGAISESTNGEGYLGYVCRAGKPCKYIVRFGLACEGGKTYTIKYQVDGYPVKPAELTCDMGGDMLYMTDFDGFSDDITGEVGVTIIAKNIEGHDQRYRYTIIGLVEAVTALTDAGYLVSAED